MRYIYQGTFRAYNELLSDATVTVYLTGTTTLATIYEGSTGAADTNSAVTTDSAGGFSFYVDELDYMPDQLFDITLSKTGYTEKTYSKVSIFPSKTPNIATTAISYAMLLSDDVINCTATATVTPLTASTCTGKEVEIRNSGSGTVTVSGTISGVTNPTLSQYECLTIRSDGTVWYEVRPKYSVVSTTTTDAVNVTTNINGHAITDIFESDGTTVKNATLSAGATNVTTNINGHAITDIFETGGVVVKNATSATSATSATTATTATNAINVTKWVALTATTDFATTAASTSTITMNTDQTANILVGYAIKFTLSGTVYYAQCSAIAANLLTIRGAPLTTDAGALTAVSYSPLPSQVMELYLPVDGYYEDATDSALLITDMRYQYKWNLSKAYMINISHMQRVVDTGTEANVNVLVNSAAVCTANTNQGRTMSSSADTWVTTDIDISSTNYDINYGETIEIQATKAGNGDARDLTVSVVLVFP